MPALASRHSLHRIARAAAIAVLVALAIATIGIAIAWSQATREPVWWPGPSAASPADAEAVERAIIDELAHQRPDGDQWSIEITEDAARAWMELRLPLWLAHEGVEWPWPGARVGVRLEEGHVRIGVARSERAFPRIIGATITLTVVESGHLAVGLRAAHLGRFVGQGLIARAASRWALDAAGSPEHASWLVGERSIPIPPIRLENGRSVELVGVASARGRLRLTFRARVDPTGRAYHEAPMPEPQRDDPAAPRTILFVCTGNTCRSPMAEAIARTVLDAAGPPSSHARVGSAGAFATDGSPAAPEAIRAVARVGADLTRFRSRALTPAMLAEADIILAMTASHVAAIVAIDPSAADRVYLLDPSGADIPDPLGASQPVYDQTAARLHTLIHRRLADLLGDVPGQTTGAAP